jgi:hypothetical protein
MLPKLRFLQFVQQGKPHAPIIGSLELFNWGISLLGCEQNDLIHGRQENKSD